MEKILYDGTTDKAYIMLSPPNAHRAYSDPNFATSLLHAKMLEEKNKKILHFSSTPNNIRTDAMPEPEILDTVSEQETTPTLHNDQQLDDCEESCLCRWTEACVVLLLRTYEKMEEKFNSGKISHKKCWELVAEVLKNEGYNCTGPQCSSKFKKLKKRYKSIKDHNSKSGNDRRTWQHFEIMDNMFSKKAWCKPVALASSTGQLVKNTEDFSTSSDLLNDFFYEKKNKLSKKRKNKKTCMMDLLEQRLIQKEEHEKKRQKRYDDKILLKTKLVDTLSNLFNVLTN